MDANSLIEGHCKFRDGKKWKTRWAVITKLSPVADCLQLQIYRDEKERARNGHTKASLSLQHFLALESGFTLDKESHTLAIICQDLSVVLSFDNRERLIQWSVRIANNLGEGHQFLVQLASAPRHSKLSPGPVRLHVTDRKFCLTGGIPPRLLGAWEVAHLRRYGIVEGRLVFEGGSRCGKLQEGVHVLIPDPPQIHLIVDALDMSSKGQLVRMPSRRFGSVVDSPRKSMTSRLSEMRNMSGILPAESSTNISMASCGMSVISSHNGVLPLSTSNRISSPTPRESRSVDELCQNNGAGVIADVNGSASGSSSSHPQQHQHHHSHSHSHGQNTFWMSSESSSSRCDLDSVDNLSVMNCENEHCSNMNVKSPRTASPIKGQSHSHSHHHNTGQISKPLPSAMERCLSCMSKLGAQGGSSSASGGNGVGVDVLSPSWTMDLNGVGVSGISGMSGMTMSMSQSQVVQKTTTGGSGSVGSASNNSDRLSISSHGSSGGVTEFYYDTPRSVLMAEMRRNNNNSSNNPNRSNTPPVPQSQNHNHGHNHSHHHNSSGGQLPLSFPAASGNGPASGNGESQSSCCINHHVNTTPNTNCQSSPQRQVQQQHGNSNSNSSVRNSTSSSCSGSATNGKGCGFNACHCHIGIGGQNQSQTQPQQTGPIYYNEACEIQQQQGKSGPVKAPSSVNLHSGPYENYDFPRCTTTATTNSLGSATGTGSGSGTGSISGSSSQTTSNQVNYCINGSSNPHPTACNNIDWSKKQAMDRSSIASSAAMSSDPMSEFYDTPRRLNLDGSAGCCCGCGNTGNHHNNNTCSSSSSTTASNNTHNNTNSQQTCACSACQSGSNPSQNQPLYQNSAQNQSQSQSSSSAPAPLCSHRADPLENYDVPPCFNSNNPHPHLPHHPHHHLHQHSSLAGLGSSSNRNHSNSNGLGVGTRVNGEGKMPLVAGGTSSGLAGMPIYAQVDKSKKTQRLMNQQPSSSSLSSSLSTSNNCDNNILQNQSQHIYQNSSSNLNLNSAFPCSKNQNQHVHQVQVQHEPSYINLEEPKSLPPKKTALHTCAQIHQHQSQPQQPLQLQHQAQNNVENTPIPTATPTSNLVLSSGAGDKSSNYVNMDFSKSLCLYENSNDVRNSVQQLNSSSSTTITKIITTEATIEAVIITATPENLVEKVEIPSVELEKKEEVKDVEKVEKGEDQVDQKLTQEVEKKKSSHKDDVETVNLPLRRSSSVPCKGGHANRGSASSSDSGVSGDGGLYFDDGSPLGDFGSLCLHESLPRKAQRSSPSSSTGGKNTSTTSTPKPQESIEVDVEITMNEGGEISAPTATNPVYSNSSAEENILSATLTAEDGQVNGVSMTTSDSLNMFANRHYETIEETLDSSLPKLSNSTNNSNINNNPNNNTSQIQNQSQSISMMKSQSHVQRPKNHPLNTLVSDANSTSSGASDMSDYLETLSSCSRGSSETNAHLLGHQNSHVHPQLLTSSTSSTSSSAAPFSQLHLQQQQHHHHSIHHSVSSGVDISASTSASASPKRATNLKPRSGKEYFKIDRTVFTK